MSTRPPIAPFSCLRCCKTITEAMVRFLKSVCEEFTTPSEVDRFMVTEHIINLLYIPATALISLSAMGKHNIIPYATIQQWRLLLPASIYLTFANARDLHICMRNFFLPSDAISPTYKTLFGQMQLASSLFMTLGSMSLFNACVIGILNTENNTSELIGCRQYAVSFGLFVTGSAANTLPLGHEFEEYDTSRALLTFQHIVVSVLFCLEACLLLPELTRQDSLDFRDTFVTSLSVIASVLLVFSSIVNYFHNLGLLQTYRRFVEGEDDYKELRENEERESERRGWFQKFFRLLGSKSTQVKEHGSYNELEIDDPYEADTLFVSDSSTTGCIPDDAFEERIGVNMEEGEYRSDTDERSRKHGRRKKKRKGKRG